MSPDRRLPAVGGLRHGALFSEPPIGEKLDRRLASCRGAGSARW
jgi:hypothetical protein